MPKVGNYRSKWGSTRVHSLAVTHRLAQTGTPFSLAGPRAGSHKDGGREGSLRGRGANEQARREEAGGRSQKVKGPGTGCNYAPSREGPELGDSRLFTRQAAPLA